MAVKTNLISLDEALKTVVTVAKSEKNYLQAWNTKLSSNITAVLALEMLANLERALAPLSGAEATPGLTAYTQQQLGLPTYDIVAESTAMRNALIAIQSWLKANIPANSVSIVDGVLTGATYTPAQTAALKALVLAAIATID